MRRRGGDRLRPTIPVDRAGDLVQYSYPSATKNSKKARWRLATSVCFQMDKWFTSPVIAPEIFPDIDLRGARGMMPP